MRNGNRWRVAGIDPATNRIAAERLDDGARVVFDGDYLREHVTLGYAVTVHSAQGVTADTTHAVLGENTTRSMLYVAMTRGRAGEQRIPLRDGSARASTTTEPAGRHVLRRGTPSAGPLARAIIANHDDQPTPHTTSLPAPRAPCCPRRSADWSTDGLARAPPARRISELAGRSAALRTIDDRVPSAADRQEPRT